MRWAKVADDKFNPDKPNLADTGLVVVPALHEHGPLWHTGLDGFPLLRKNDTVDYPWHGMLFILRFIYTFTKHPIFSMARR